MRRGEIRGGEIKGKRGDRLPQEKEKNQESLVAPFTGTDLLSGRGKRPFYSSERSESPA